MSVPRPGGRGGGGDHAEDNDQFLRLAPTKRVVAWIRAHAPQCPPCFNSQEQWIEWLAFAHESRERVVRPSLSIYSNGVRRREFNAAINFCVDCDTEYRIAMTATGRCRPDHLSSLEPPPLEESLPSPAAEDEQTDEFTMLNTHQKGARAERELFELLTHDLRLDRPLQRQLSQARGGGSDATNHDMPWSIEVKNQAKIRRALWWRQAVTQAARERRYPILFYRRRRHRGEDVRDAWTAVVPGVNVGGYTPPEGMLVEADIRGYVVSYEEGVRAMRAAIEST